VQDKGLGENSDSTLHVMSDAHRAAGIFLTKDRSQGPAQKYIVRRLVGSGALQVQQIADSHMLMELIIEAENREINGFQERKSKNVTPQVNNMPSRVSHSRNVPRIQDLRRNAYNGQPRGNVKWKRRIPP
jgi:hypothetical protein